jgi:hypothetical protein
MSVMVEMHNDVATSVRKYDRCAGGMINPAHEIPWNAHEVI